MSSGHSIFRTVTDTGLERVLLVSVALDGGSVHEAETREMTRLVESAGGVVAGHVSQRRDRPDAGFFVGRGKAEEIALHAGSLDVSTIILDHELSPGQVHRLEETTKCKVIDRTELILAIFAVQARTLQAKLRIELAQLEYMLPRLTGMWHHLDRLGAGIGTRGPGETQLEVDRRRARTRISCLEDKLAAIESSTRVRARRRSGMFSVALAGYTNAGKSTLLNRLCDAGVRSEDRLFATLDATSRRLKLPDGETVLLNDTVGFIRKLPRMLLDSFRSTLEAVTQADLILLLADASDPERDGCVATVTETLERIGAGDIPRELVWNKCDLDGSGVVGGTRISALTGLGMDELLSIIQQRRRAALDWCRLSVDICSGETEHWLRENSIIGSFNRGSEGEAEVICGFYLGSDHARRYLDSRGVTYSIGQAPGPAEKENDAHH